MTMEKDTLYDLCIVTDATASMSTFLQSLSVSLPQILDLSQLTDAFASISMIAYRDYCDRPIIQQSGCAGKGEEGEDTIEHEKLIKFAASIRAIGGGDYPEAAKTAVYRIVKDLHAKRKTVVIWYADAPPHLLKDGADLTNTKLEMAALNAAGGDALRCLDWISACKMLQEKNVQVFPIISPHSDDLCYRSYCVLATVTGGCLFKAKSFNEVSLSNITINILLDWMGIQKFVMDEKEVMQLHFANEKKTIENLKSEVDLHKSNGNFDTVPQKIPSRKTPVEDFHKRFTKDEDYKCFAMQMLSKIIQRDVTTISVNPVFGSLWRAVCNDRLNTERVALVNDFSVAVSKISDEETKKRMKIWLEESYDYAKDIQILLESIPQEEMYPAVCIDPTVVEIGPKFWKREDLLEVSRSCNSKVLQRLTKVLTSLTYIPDESSLPKHFRGQQDLPILPLVLLEKKYFSTGKSFWNILLHLVLPGTILSQRPASLLAGLCFNIQLPFLKEEAFKTISCKKGTWIDLEIPENWSSDFIRLLLSIDENSTERGGILNNSERKLFSNLYRFRTLELNLSSPVSVLVGHTPEKVYAPIGPLVLCKSCNIRRSVTIMSDDKCGLCCAVYTNREHENKSKTTRVALDEDAEMTKACWVECRLPTCRAQYIVYCVELLNVQPKCHYCRNNERCPFIECAKCLNRVVYPKKYRSMDNNIWRCVFCKHEQRSIVEETVTIEKLSEENGNSWLLGKMEKLKFEKKTIFSIARSHDLKLLEESLKVLPQNDSLKLTLQSKVIHNPLRVLESLQSILSSGKLYKNICSLCFEDFRPELLARACGRKGCQQLACSSCLLSWYGQNGPGKILNLMTLNCPFCRRRPTCKTVRNFFPNIRGIIGFDVIVAEQNEWIHAWCSECGSAKRLMERECARACQEVSNWTCEACNEKRHTVQENVLANLKECPGCTVTTDKFTGCNHITCPCGVHWCWVCSFKASTGEQIYAHLVKTHGSIVDFEEYDSDGD